MRQVGNLYMLLYLVKSPAIVRSSSVIRSSEFSKTYYTAGKRE